MLYDVLIIGAGCTGVMTARLLSEKNVKVALVEAGEIPAHRQTPPSSMLVTTPNPAHSKLSSMSGAMSS